MDRLSVIKKDGKLYYIFLRQIQVHTQDANDAYQKLRFIYANRNTDNEFRDTVWTSIEHFLSSSSLLSKFLFPSSKKVIHKRRGNNLLFLLNKTDAQLCSLQERKLRNRYEHFDEDIDDWWRNMNTVSDVSKTLAIKAIDGLDDNIIYGPDVDFMFKYNPTTGAIYHLNDEFNIHSIFNDIIEVSSQIPFALNKLEEISGNSYSWKVQ